MKSLTLAALTLVIMSSVASNAAFALTVDQTAATNKDGSARFGDPDDKIPFPHVADDGTPPTSNFQAQAVGNTGMSFGLTPSNSQPDAFQRAQENQQQ